MNKKLLGMAAAVLLAISPRIASALAALRVSRLKEFLAAEAGTLPLRTQRLEQFSAEVSR